MGVPATPPGPFPTAPRTPHPQLLTVLVGVGNQTRVYGPNKALEAVDKWETGVIKEFGQNDQIICKATISKARGFPNWAKMAHVRTGSCTFRAQLLGHLNPGAIEVKICQSLMAPEPLWAWVCSILDSQDAIKRRFN